MFGLGKTRKRFNGDVDTTIVKDYAVQTHGNPDWPGVLAYLDYLDLPWRKEWSVDEAALYMVMLYYDGLVTAKRSDEARVLFRRIEVVAEQRVKEGHVGAEKWAHFQNVTARHEHASSD